MIHPLCAKRMTERAAEMFGLTVDELLARTRRHEVSHARFMLMYAMKTLGSTPTQTANLLGGMDRNSVYNGIKWTENMIPRVPWIRNVVDEIIDAGGQWMADELRKKEIWA